MNIYCLKRSVGTIPGKYNMENNLKFDVFSHQYGVQFIVIMYEDSQSTACGAMLFMILFTL